MPHIAQAISKEGVQVHSFDEFLALGKANPAPPVPPSPEDYCTIMYTSGTTGDPKVGAGPQWCLWGLTRVLHDGLAAHQPADGAVPPTPHTVAAI